MKWLRRLFGGKGEEARDSKRALASSIAQASNSIGNATLMMLDKMEEMFDKPLSAQERQSAAQSLDNLESTLATGVVSPAQVKDVRKRLRKLREKLSQGQDK